MLRSLHNVCDEDAFLHDGNYFSFQQTFYRFQGYPQTPSPDKPASRTSSPASTGADWASRSPASTGADWAISHADWVISHAGFQPLPGKECDLEELAWRSMHWFNHRNPNKVAETEKAERLQERLDFRAVMAESEKEFWGGGSLLSGGEEKEFWAGSGWVLSVVLCLGFVCLFVSLFLGGKAV